MEDLINYIWDNWIKNQENLPLTISIVALFSAILYNRLTFRLARKQSIASVMPILELVVVRNEGKRSVNIYLKNIGLGPARYIKIQHVKEGLLYKKDNFLNTYNVIKEAGVGNYLRKIRSEKKYDNLLLFLKETRDESIEFDFVCDVCAKINWLGANEKSYYLKLRCKNEEDYHHLIKFTERFVTTIEYKDVYGEKTKMTHIHDWNTFNNISN